MARYRQLQAQAHPDRFATASEAERLRAVQFTSFINQAYTTLQSPLERAAYLLSLKGEDPEKVDQSHLGADLLMEQMQLREALDELPRDETSLAALERMREEVQDKMLRRQAQFASALMADVLSDARKSFHEMQFLAKLLTEIEAGEEARLGY